MDLKKISQLHVYSFNNNLTSLFAKCYSIKSNIEAGEGFADIVAETEDPDSGIIVELKYTKEFERMEQACQKAIAQIKNQRYYEYLLNDDRRHG